MGDPLSILYHFIQEVFIELDIDIIDGSMPKIDDKMYSAITPAYDDQQVYDTIEGDREASKGLLRDLLDWYHHLHLYKTENIDQSDPRVREKVEEILLARQICRHKLEDKAEDLFKKGPDGKTVLSLPPDLWKVFVNTTRAEINEYKSKFNRLEIEISDILKAAGGQATRK
ncbi:hypothetical protein F5Y03DRAFT_390659 [Xylaria venustula]|nr:hypothetical protein F5Y03DRAFT_390659 [Xylaria venustula]